MARMYSAIYASMTDTMQIKIKHEVAIARIRVLLLPGYLTA